MPDIENLLNIEDEVTQVLSDLGVNEKLNEMDDFMNQNDLKVQITNENAVVTGLVTYTCTVKDKNNTALANKVVEWYKGTTLIGIDATDSNGVSTFSHRVTEADIYDVHAIVRGTHAGDDIRMFVKEKRNLLSYELWTLGDYGNLPNLNRNGWGHIFYDKSTDYCTNGDYGVKATNDGIANRPNLRYWMPDVSEFASKTLKFSADVKNNESLNITVFQYDGSEYTSNATTIPANSDDNFSVTITVLETTTALWFGLDYVNATTENTCFYTDNWSLEEVTQ